MNEKHRKTLVAIFAKPTRADVEWRTIEALLSALGATITEGAGSRVRVRMGNAIAVFHRPHPQKETGKGMLNSVRAFLQRAGVEP